MHTWAMCELAARRRGGLGEDWTIFSAEVLPHGWNPQAAKVYRVGIGIARPITRGPRKGQPTWDGPRREDWIPESDLEAEARTYERETGNCCSCLGDGKELVRWSVDEGSEYRPCRDCNGTGKALS